MTDLYRTYSENVRTAAKRKGLSIRDLSNRTGFSYEHMRKIFWGRTPKRADVRLTISESCNNMLCSLLDLPAEEMFKLAEQEKYAQKNGYAPVQLPDPAGQELADLWPQLRDDQKAILVRMGHSFASELVAAS